MSGDLRDREKRLVAELESVRAAIQSKEVRCQHDWTNPVYDPIRHEAYTSPGDPPGTMGVDWRGPVHVPASTEKRWKRECRKCGKVEFTTRSVQLPGPHQPQF